MGSLLDLAFKWTHCDLTLYIDDGAIFTISATTNSATISAIKGFEEALAWLKRNGLSADLAKTKLMTFKPPCANKDLLGGYIWGGCHVNPNSSPNRISTTKSLCYLSVYITPDLEWTKHMDIMVNYTCSTIYGISVLRNSI